MIKDYQLSDDSISLRRYHWPTESAKMCMIIVHGIAEHASRYDAFASIMNKKGVAVLSIDLRGHGESLLDNRLGWFGPGGWKRVVKDISALIAYAKEHYPSLPLVLFGHSMGSIFTQATLMETPNQIDAAVLTGVAADKPGRRSLAPAIASIVCFFNGDKPSPLMNGLTFSSYNKAFLPARTEFDWLSAVPENVDAYVKNPLCGFVCTASLYREVAALVFFITRLKNIRKIPETLPVLALSGSMDPVGNEGRTLEELSSLWKTAGKDFRAQLIQGGRHELLNDVTASITIKKITDFISEIIGAPL